MHTPLFWDWPVWKILDLSLVTARKVIFSEGCVKNSVHRGGGLPQCMLGYQTPPSEQTPPRTDTPPEQTPLPGADTFLPEQCILGDTANKRVVRMLLETYNVVKCSQKLHEIERIWTKIASTILLQYVDPPLSCE